MSDTVNTGAVTEEAATKTRKPRATIEDSELYKSIEKKLSSTQVTVASKSVTIDGVERSAWITVAMDGTFKVFKSMHNTNNDEQVGSTEYEGKSLRSACIKFNSIV